MLVLFCDGSTKMKQQCVVTSCVVTLVNKDHIIKEVLYCAKKSYFNHYNDSIHELLAIIDALQVYDILQTNLSAMIVSDSMEMIKTINTYRSEGLWYGKNNPHNNDLKILLDRYTKEAIQFQWQPRTTLGLNVTDFLNKEIQYWTNAKDKPFLTSQMKKLLKKDYRYNISSKNNSISICEDR